ncbi:hypothetical protein Tco_0963126 [Tanacetum coccineum]
MANTIGGHNPKDGKIEINGQFLRELRDIIPVLEKWRREAMVRIAFRALFMKDSGVASYYKQRSIVDPFSTWQAISLEIPKLVNMMIEMADISMQSPKDIVKNVLDSFRTFRDFNNNMSIRIDDFEINDLWDDLDPGVLTTDNDRSKPEFFSIKNRVHQHNPYNLQVTCKIGIVNFNPYIDPHCSFNIMSKATYNTIMTRELVYTGNNIVGLAKNLNVFIGHHTLLIDFIVVEDIHEFVEKGLTEVMFGKSFKDQTGLEENLKRGVILFKVGKNKTIFNMPREERIFNKLTTKQHYMMPPILKISDEDMAKGVSQPYEKIKKFYKGCLDLGNEYKQDKEVIDWIRRGHVIIMEYLVNISKRRAFWSLNEDILKITILKTNTPYPSRKIRCIRACIHQRPQRNKTQYAVSRRSQYAVLEIWNEYNILEDIKRGPYSKKSLIRRI